MQLAVATHPGMMDRKSIVEEDDVIERSVAADLFELSEDIFVRAAASVFTGSFIKLVVHARRAVGAWEGTAALGGDVDYAVSLIEKIAGQKRQRVERLERRSQRRSRPALRPDVANSESRKASPFFEGVHKLPHRLFALAQA